MYSCKICYFHTKQTSKQSIQFPPARAPKPNFEKQTIRNKVKNSTIIIEIVCFSNIHRKLGSEYTQKNMDIYSCRNLAHIRWQAHSFVKIEANNSSISNANTFVLHSIYYQALSRASSSCSSSFFIFLMSWSTWRKNRFSQLFFDRFVETIQSDWYRCGWWWWIVKSNSRTNAMCLKQRKRYMSKSIKFYMKYN